MKKLWPGLLAVITVGAMWLVLDLTPIGPWLAKRWTDLDNTQGFVIGAVVALFGVLVNNLALARIEKARHERAMEVDALRHERAKEVADIEWRRETSKVMDAKRRDLHGDLIAMTQGAWSVIRIEDNEERVKQRRALSSEIGGTLARIRLLSDEVETIQAAREFAARAILMAGHPTTANMQAFEHARHTFVRLARTELGRKALPDLPSIDELIAGSDSSAAAMDASP